MWRLREHVDWGNQVSRVTSLHQELHVAHQRSWVAGDVDNLLWLRLDSRVNKFLGQALTRRVNEDHVSLQALFRPLRHQFFCLARVVLGIVNVVDAGIVLGVLDRWLDYFNPADFLDVLGR